MVSASKRLVLSYNGEIYNADDLRCELEAKGVRFRGHSDTEVLLEACSMWGIHSTAKRLIGMFAFAVWDRDERSLYLVRDRLGIKPLHYIATYDRFAFGSELKSLCAHPRIEAEVDPQAATSFLALDHIPAPYSIWRGVRKLEPGTILRVRAAALDRVEVEHYWTLEEAAIRGISDRFPGTLEEAADELELLLTDAVKRRMVADVPIGAFLSGGIDSSTVVAIMQKESMRPVKTFTIGFSEGDFDEAPFARRVAGYLGTDHRELYLSESDVQKHVPDIMTHHDEPFADPSLIPTFFLCRLARSEVTVALSGDGGDEIFGGYSRHMMAERLFGHSVWGLAPTSRAMIGKLLVAAPRHLRSYLLNLVSRRDASGGPLSLAEVRLLAYGMRSSQLLHHLLEHGDLPNVREIDNSSVAERESKASRHFQHLESLSPSERQQFIDAISYLPDNILTKVDRASMAVSLEARVPILDHRIVEFSFRLPSRMKASTHVSKRILREVLGRHLESSMFERPKRGFGGPVDDVWLSGPLKGWVNDLMVRKGGFEQGIGEGAAGWPTRVGRRGREGGWHGRRGFRSVALAAWAEAHT